MFPTITEKEWEVFFRVVGKIASTGEGSENERMQWIWEKAENDGFYVELGELTSGLEANRDEDDSEVE